MVKISGLGALSLLSVAICSAINPKSTEGNHNEKELTSSPSNEEAEVYHYLDYQRLIKRKIMMGCMVCSTLAFTDEESDLIATLLFQSPEIRAYQDYFTGELVSPIFAKILMP